MRFKNEIQFKNHLAELMSSSGHEFIREVNISEQSLGLSAFVDFISKRSGGWMLECKLGMSFPEFTRAIGQCIAYREILRGEHCEFDPFIVYPIEVAPEHKKTDYAWDMYYYIAGQHGIVLCSDSDIIAKLEPNKGREQKLPFSVQCRRVGWRDAMLQTDKP